MHLNHTSTALADTLRLAREWSGETMSDLTVLSPQVDPFRLDTLANHRDAEWLAEAIADLLPGNGDDDPSPIHLRGLHYVLVSDQRVKPNGETYVNDEKNWLWMSEKAAKAARWLGLLPWERIRDQRNDPPTVRIWEHEEPESYLNVDIDIQLPELEELLPQISVDHFVGVQPFKLVIVGEKSSLGEVLGPIAQQRQADLYLPTGEISDTLIHQMAQIGADDERPMVVFYFSDCDPAGWQMSVSVGRKLQAFQASLFPDLRFQMVRVALTPEQVKEYGLPISPLKDTESRGDRWKESYGVEQTEIDALAALRPDLLHQIALDAINPFFDAELADRVRDARDAWLADAQQAVENQLGPERLEEIGDQARQGLADMAEQIEAIKEQLHIDTDGFDLPELPEIPEPEIDVEGLPSPLIDSAWGFAECSRVLKATKAYEDA